jgi:hypothetical protein
MLSYILYMTAMSVVFVLPAYAGIVVKGAPELDAGTLSTLAAGFTGAYAALRVYQAKKK